MNSRKTITNSHKDRSGAPKAVLSNGFKGIPQVMEDHINKPELLMKYVDRRSVNDAQQKRLLGKRNFSNIVKGITGHLTLRSFKWS